MKRQERTENAQRRRKKKERKQKGCEACRNSLSQTTDPAHLGRHRRRQGRRKGFCVQRLRFVFPSVVRFIVSFPLAHCETRETLLMILPMTARQRNNGAAHRPPRAARPVHAARPAGPGRAHLPQPARTEPVAGAGAPAAVPARLRAVHAGHGGHQHILHVAHRRGPRAAG